MRKSWRPLVFRRLAVTALWFVFGLVLTLFEAFVAFLQAYVFAILSTVYISMSYPEE